MRQKKVKEPEQKNKKCGTYFIILIVDERYFKGEFTKTQIV